MSLIKTYNVHTDALPTICQAKGCLDDAVSGFLLCEKHLKKKRAKDKRHPLEKKTEHPVAYGDRVIYFIQSGDGGPIKIGQTKNHSAVARMTTLQADNPEQLTILAEVRGKAWLEKELHMALNKSRIRGEWFEPSPQVLEAVEAAKLGFERVVALTRALYTPEPAI